MTLCVHIENYLNGSKFVFASKSQGERRDYGMVCKSAKIKLARVGNWCCLLGHLDKVEKGELYLFQNFVQFVKQRFSSVFHALFCSKHNID